MARVSESGAFGRALAGQREAINVRFTLARREHRRLDGAAYMEALARWGGPVVEAAAAHDAGSADAVCAAVADAALELVARGYMGEHTRAPLMHTLWEQALPQLGRFVAAEPARVIHAMSNAVVSLAADPQARVFDWIRWTVALSARCASAGELLEVGKVLAWRAGMAHWRASALACAGALPGPLALQALGLTEAESARLDAQAVLAELGSSAWAKPGAFRLAEAGGPSELKLVGTVGGFRGFGGVFGQPPQVAATPDGQLYAYSGDGCWSIHADCFGATLQRHGRELPEGVDEQAGEFKLTAGGRVTYQKLRAELPQLAKRSSFAACGTMMAVTLWHSHRIYLVAAI